MLTNLLYTCRFFFWFWFVIILPDPLIFSNTYSRSECTNIVFCFFFTYKLIQFKWIQWEADFVFGWKDRQVIEEQNHWIFNTFTAKSSNRRLSEGLWQTKHLEDRTGGSKYTVSREDKTGPTLRPSQDEVLKDRKTKADNFCMRTRKKLKSEKDGSQHGLSLSFKVLCHSVVAEMEIVSGK